MAAPKKAVMNTQDTLLAAYQIVLDEARAEFEEGLQDQAQAWKIELSRIKEDDLYNFNKEKRSREDILDRQIQGRIEELDKLEESVLAREQAVANSADLLDSLQIQVADIPLLLTAAEAKGYNRGLADAEKNYNAEVKLLTVETSADTKILTNQISALQTSVSTADALIAKLTAEVTEANKRVESVANSAFQSAGQSKVTVQNTTGK